MAPQRPVRSVGNGSRQATRARKILYEAARLRDMAKTKISVRIANLTTNCWRWAVGMPYFEVALKRLAPASVQLAGVGDLSGPARQRFRPALPHVWGEHLAPFTFAATSNESAMPAWPKPTVFPLKQITGRLPTLATAGRANRHQSRLPRAKPRWLMRCMPTRRRETRYPVAGNPGSYASCSYYQKGGQSAWNRS